MPRGKEKGKTTIYKAKQPQNVEVQLGFNSSNQPTQPVPKQQSAPIMDNNDFPAFPGTGSGGQPQVFQQKKPAQQQFNQPSPQQQYNQKPKGRGGTQGSANYQSNNNRAGAGNPAQDNYSQGRGGGRGGRGYQQRGGGYQQKSQQQNNVPGNFPAGVNAQQFANQFKNMNAPQMLPHMENLYAMETSELKDLLEMISNQYGQDFLLQAAQQQNYAKNNIQDRQQQRGYNNQNQQNRSHNQNQRGHNNNNNYRGQQQFNRNDFNEEPQVYQAKNSEGSNGQNEGKMEGQNNNSQAPMPMAMPQFNQMGRNLCEKHFPEPIIMFLDKEKSLCKKCVPEYIEENIKKQKKGKDSEEDGQVEDARMAGIKTMAINAYQTEQTQISRSVDHISKFNRELRYMQEGITESDEESTKFLRELPPLMSALFEKLQEAVVRCEQSFRNKIYQVVRSQQKVIQDDMKNKLPSFYNRLFQKYTQLQQASQVAQARGMEELVETLKHYLQIFNELDAEYEKYFNDYESVSKLQRLLDKDPNEIVKEFSDMVENNLRVDFNTKNSFGASWIQRLHSFQWNQRSAQIYKIKTGQFERRPVTMQHEVPLYSRSIAIETGTIYLTGGYFKAMNMYLKSCYRYDELFGTLFQVASMHYPHADHSVCAIQGFLYVVGTFVNNQVFGYCEQYDSQQDKWKVLAEMRVPRTGVSLCAFKNDYMFAFGGRVDQKRIVDTIECYDIKRNVWQEIQTPMVDKSNWMPSYMGLAHQITEKEIMIFGGKSAVMFQIFNGCYVFDVEKMCMREHGSLVNPCSFMNTPLVFDGSLYAYGNDVYVHRYNIQEAKWSVIAKTAVVLPKH